MSKNFEIIELVGISTQSISDAIQQVVLEVSKQKKVGWFEVTEQRGRVNSEGKIEFQVTVKIGTKINE
ncbi:MAG: dodecin family protein [Stygiobacter sp.]|jgi:flavin-binding protein dodecin|uniref:Dodecin family protein n=1 Tax=Stygiobacter electus TaxID=3032292 RepID=A0AAE3TD36_9BACT|nr:dodecin family protein [Stygiobacter electus]MDF1611072.1 dodecin family protein [Stygiobacter electus]